MSRHLHLITCTDRRYRYLGVLIRLQEDNITFLLILLIHKHILIIIPVIHSRLEVPRHHRRLRHLPLCILVFQVTRHRLYRMDLQLLTDTLDSTV